MRIRPQASQMETRTAAVPVRAPVTRWTIRQMMPAAAAPMLRKMPKKSRSPIGLTEKEVTPSQASASILRRGYLLSPANRSARA